MTTTTPVAVLTEELARPDPTPRRLLRALRTAGFEIKAAQPPAWMPSTPEAQHLVERAAQLARQGQARDEIAACLRKDKRTINRYLAAADVLGLLSPDTEEPPE
ncbi:hypothetical protein FXF51_01710 [Nonomuraea sp. PA05]|uniref:hypothetical protein n=1 Tax=Nonomuraea sp. PA05 TaxID=2604466 RepID=UPI0011D5556E|nr:hypothetical protein [Nonomuraea sp. PA05]TYB71178.1 hypothetical protein FXF51_01710 [Nonomuraea sp. PA05]